MRTGAWNLEEELAKVGGQLEELEDEIPHELEFDGWSEYEFELFLQESYKAKSSRGERDMAAWYTSRGWHFVPGEPDHQWNSPGPDGIAWRPGRRGGLQVRILDNKATKDLTVDAASAFDSRSLSAGLSKAVHALHTHPVWRGVHRAADLRRALNGALQRAMRGKPMPQGVSLVVTNAGGKAVKVSPALRRRGVRLQDIAGNRRRRGRPAGRAGARPAPKRAATRQPARKR